MNTYAPQCLLYAQHGWADDHRAIATLADSLADPSMLVFAPSLGYVKTWLRIEPLIQQVENLALETTLRHPELPLRIIGHSMGGLIWLEVLDRHPELWSRVEALVLVGSPVGGADLARALDPFNLGIGIARDLGKNRRPIAERIATQIPTLVIAGDIDHGSDGTITVQSTKVFGTQFVSLPGVAHAPLKNHPAVAAAIAQFWSTLPSRRPTDGDNSEILTQYLIRRLQNTLGMTDAHLRDFPKAQPYLTFANGVSLRRWKHPLGIDHIFVACPAGTCLYGGFVGWAHSAQLHQTLKQLQQDHSTGLLL